MESALDYRRNRRLQSRRRLGWAAALTAATFVVEAVGGWVTNSLALLSDAAHLFSHLLALLVALVAAALAERPPTARRSYGLNRLEILAALFNGASLLVITFGVIYEAYQRLREPEPVAISLLLAIAFGGLVVNLACAYILRDIHRHDLNVRGVFLHLLTDTLSSVAVLLGGLVMAVTGFLLLDPILSVVICLVILYWAYRLLLDSVDILLEATPREVDLDEVVRWLKQIPGIRDVHHLHVWTITSGMYALSAHLDVDDLKVSETERLAIEAEALLRERSHISHTTFQFECSRGARPALTELELCSPGQRRGLCP